MRILALTNLYPNPLQPHRAAFNRQQFAALAREHQVQVIAPIPWTGEAPSWIPGRRRNRGKGTGYASASIPPCRHRISDGMAIHHPRYMFTPKVLRGFYGHFFEASVRECFYAAIREFRPDVVLGGWAYPDGWAAVRLAREFGLPIAVKVHGSDVLTIEEYPARLRRTAEALTSADAVIVVSHHLAERAVALGVDPARTRVIRNGIDSIVFHPSPKAAARAHLGINGDAPLILFAGNLVPVKGLDVFIDALAKVAHSGAPFQCAIIGNGPLKAALSAQAESLGLADRIRFIGARPLDELARWYHASDLFVLPSRSEGMPNVLFEAAACGTPFIATSVGGIPEFAHPESLVAPGDSAALAQRIARFLNPSTRPICDARFPPTSWTDSARGLATVLAEIVASTSAAKRRAA
jgi:glycosyltransferase involved in cell wall biosynthesis